MDYVDASASDTEEEVEISYETVTSNCALHRAARYGTVELVSFLLRSGWSINISSILDQRLSRQGLSDLVHTPLLAAIAGGDAKIVTLLLENGATPDHGRRVGRPTALQSVVAQGRADLAALLLKHGANIHRGLRGSFDEFDHGWVENTSDRIRAIHVAACEGHVDVMRLLLKHGASINDRSEMGLTPLHVASKWGKLQVVEFLIDELNAGIDERDEAERTPLQHACRQGQVRIAKYLLEKGANVHIKDDRGLTALLHYATDEMAEVELALDLIQRGASVRDITNDGRTSVHLALQREYHDPNSKLVRLFHEHGADIHAKDRAGNTPLHLADTFSGDDMLKYVEYLTRNGADVLAKNVDGELPINRIATRSSDMAMKVLIEMSPDSNMVDHADKIGTTPLHQAAYAISLANVRLLLAHGANVHAVSSRSGTPLHWLIDARAKLHPDRVDIAKLLISYGANVNATDRQGLTPLDHAARPQILNEGSPLVDFLIQHGAAGLQKGPVSLSDAIRLGSVPAISRLVDGGADVNGTDKDGITALYHASRFPRTPIIKALLQSGADPSIAAPSTPLLPLHLVSKGRAPLTSIVWMLLRAANLPWLEPSCTRVPPASRRNCDVKSTIPARQALFLTDVMAETTGSQDLSRETPARSVAKTIWQKITWRAEDSRRDGSRSAPVYLYNKWKGSIAKLQESRDLLLNSLHGGPLLYFRLIIEIGAAFNLDKHDEQYEQVTEQLHLLEQMALTDMLEHRNKLSSNDIWHLVKQSIADAGMRRAVYPGRYFERWRRFMTDILRTRNIEVKVRRALERFPPELILRVSEAVLDLEEIPRKSEWANVWSGEENPKHLLDSEIEYDDYDYFCNIPRQELCDNGSVVFDPISRKFAWVWNPFGGAVYYGFEPTFLYDRIRKRWVVNEKHLSRFRELYTHQPPAVGTFFQPANQFAFH